MAILANTRLDWVVADLGIMCAGAATTTVYPTTEPEDACYIVADSGSKVLIAENAGPGRRRSPARDLPALTHVVLIDGAADPAATLAAADAGRPGGARRRGAGRRPRADRPARRRHRARTTWPR